MEIKMYASEIYLTICIGFLFFVTFGQDREQATDKIRKRAHIPGLSVAYIGADGSVNLGTYGLKEAKKSSTIDVATLFSAASLSKPIVGYMVLQMVDQGKFDLDRPLAEYFEYEDLLNTESYPKVTARHVLSHTSGLPNWRPRGGELTFRRAPGERFGYSGEGFVWLSKVLEAITDTDFEALAQQMVFRPLGMTRTSYIWVDSTEQDYAIPHDQQSKPQKKWKAVSPNAAASLQTTAQNYARFLQAIYRGERLSSASREAMLSPQVLVKSYPEGEKISWGLGVGLQEKADGTEFWHWGDNGTFKAFFTVDVKTGTGLVYFANSSHGLAITEAMTDLYLGTAQPAIRWNDYRQLGFGFWLMKLFR